MQHYLSHGKLAAKDGERDKLKEILLQAAELDSVASRTPL